MFEIEMPNVSQEFVRCWQAAGQYIERQVQGRGQWLKAQLGPPYLEHLSFYLGNQLFFIRIEDVDGRLSVPGKRAGLLYIAEGCKGHPCIMPMQYRLGAWAPQAAGWGLVDLRTGDAVDPTAHLSNDLVEITDWELQDIAVDYVRIHLEKAGKKLIACQGNPDVDPSIWFAGDSGPEWVVVRTVRYPRLQADPPSAAKWAEISARLGKVGHFASVSVVSASETFDSSGNLPPVPLWRCHPMFARFEGLVF